MRTRALVHMCTGALVHCFFSLLCGLCELRVRLIFAVLAQEQNVSRSFSRQGGITKDAKDAKKGEDPSFTPLFWFTFASFAGTPRAGIFRGPLR